METVTALCQQLKLQGMLSTLEERLKQAQEDVLPYPQCLALLLQDEVQHRELRGLARRLQQAQFEEEKTFEQLQTGHYPAPLLRQMQELMIGQYLKEKRHVLIMGPTGTGKTHVAQALGHQACRQGKSVRFIRSSLFYRALYASRADETWDKTFKQYVKYDVLVLDDFGLTTLTAPQAEEFYELVAQRHQKGSLIITSNRHVEGWVKLFPDPVMANAVLDRLANNSYQLILEGDSFRKNLRPQSE